MYRNLLGMGVLVVAVAVLPAIDDAQKPDDKGWVQLFNGKDLTGWKIHDKPGGAIVEVITKEKDGKLVGYDGKLKDGKTVALWRVEDGILVGSGPASHLFSQRDDY